MIIIEQWIETDHEQFTRVCYVAAHFNAHFNVLQIYELFDYNYNAYSFKLGIK